MIDDEKLIKQIKKHKEEAIAGLSAQYQNIRDCRSFYDGDFQNYVDAIQFSDQNGKKKRAMLQINKVKPYVNAAAGHFAQNRRKPKYIAVLEDEKEQEEYSKYANSLSDYCRNNAFADNCESEQDLDMLIGGVGVNETAMSYGEGYATADDNGQIIMAGHEILDTWWDPSATRKNLSNRRYEGITKKYAVEEALELFDNSEENDFETDDGENTDGFSYSPDLGGNYDRIRYDWADKKEKQINVDFYNYYKLEKYYRADNPAYKANDPAELQEVALILTALGEQYEFDASSPQMSMSGEAAKAVREALGDGIKLIPFKRKVFYSAIVSGEKLFSHTKSLCQQSFPLKFKTGDRDHTRGIWVGMVNSMMEPALYYNKALTELMFVIASNSKGGAILEEDAVSDITEFEANYAKTDGVVVVRSGALAAGKVQEKKSAFTPTGYENIIAFSDANFSDVTGIDKTFLGSSENKLETAALQRQRVRQVMTILANYADSITMYMHEHARMMLDYMRVFAENNEGGMFRLLGKEGAVSFAKIRSDIMMAEYAVDLQEAPQTPDEKQENANTLLQVAAPLLAVGDPAGKVILSKAIKYMNLDTSDVSEISTALVPEQGQVDPAYVKQLEEALRQVQGELSRAQVESIRAKTDLDRAKIPQIMSDIRKQAAETEATKAMAEQTDIENTILRHTGQKNVDLHG